MIQPLVLIWPSRPEAGSFSLKLTWTCPNYPGILPKEGRPGDKHSNTDVGQYESLKYSRQIRRVLPGAQEEEEEGSMLIC